MNYVHGKNGKFSSLKARIVNGLNWLWYWIKIGTGAAVIGVGAFVYGSGLMVNEHVAYAQDVQIITKEERMAKVMQRIAGCESEGSAKKPGKQFNADGSIVTHVNADGTTDVGKYQINMQKAHIVNMARLGLNPFTEEGNEAYAKWLYENEGTGDWYSSRSCWQ